MAKTTSTPKEIFIAYAQRDQSIMREMVNLLQAPNIRIYTHKIEQKSPDSEKLSHADVVLLMVSPDFLNSDYCYSPEMIQVIEQHKRGYRQVLPILLRPIYWEDTPFANLQALPNNAQPITMQNVPSHALQEVVETIRIMVNDEQPGMLSRGYPGEEHFYSPVKISPPKPIWQRQRWTIIVTVVIALIIIFSLINSPQGFFLFLPQVSTLQAPMPTVSTSTLIPGSSPVFNDPLGNQNDPYQWDTGPEGGATCSFVQGAYHISVPAGSRGGGCNAKAPNTTFTNFVYQIKMVIVQGSSKELRTGIFFCGSPEVHGGSSYSISFNTQGDWNFGILTGRITGPAVSTTILTGTNQSFQTGTGQINYITVRVTKDHQIDAQVNGKALFSTVDKQLSGGTIGVSITNPGVTNADVAFNDAKVWQL